jgi:hypothetical protein
VTFGYKMAGLLSAVLRHRERLAQLRQRVLVGEFAGAAGTLASLETGAMETQAGLCAELGLGQPVSAALAAHPEIVAPDDFRSFGHRSRACRWATAGADWAGKPVIAIVNTWSDANPATCTSSSGWTT